MATKGDDPGSNDAQTTQRSRWATRKMTLRTTAHKRLSLLHRKDARAASNEKQQAAGGSASSGGDVVDGIDNSNGNGNGNGNGGDDNDGVPDGTPVSEDEASNAAPAGSIRKLYFNLPLPSDLVDSSGHPTQIYPRNKIRTSKYTPLSFIPKNLWFQFHNVANVFFLFLVILVCFPVFGGINPGLNSVPLIVIISATALKDAIEDYRRTVLDNELNNAPVHRLCNWKNVNVQEDNVSMWRMFKKANSRFFGAAWRWIRSLWSKKAQEERKALAEVRDRNAKEALPRSSFESGLRSQRPSMQVPRDETEPRESFVSAREDIQMTPVPSPLPRTSGGALEVPILDDTKRLSTIAVMKPDLVNNFREVRGAQFKKDAWKSLSVGDFVRIYNDDELPADIIILATSDPDGACYVETKNLDGETNLKVRQALRCGRAMKHARDCERAQFMIESEPPQPNLYKYNGAINWLQNLPDDDDPDAEPASMAEPIGIDNLLLRGCNLRNTEWILGVVLFTGHDTKIMMNAGVTPSKRSRIAREMNFSVICNFGILSIMCILSAIVDSVAWAKTDSSMYFFDWGPTGGSVNLTGFIDFWAALILFQNLVPISLYITLEIVRTLQAIFIWSDIEMYYEKIDQPCVPKAWNISDDLGQIEYIFSDKTGTLTQNVMEFKKCTINGQPYGEAYTEAQAGMQKRLGIDVVTEAKRVREEIADAKVRAVAGLRALHQNPYLHEDDVTFIAPDFVADLAGESGEEQQAANERFMLTLALCHTVIAERVPGDPPKMIFKAQSPDEAALVATARDMGFTVLGQASDGLNVNVIGEDRHFPILNTIEFNSTRKRMSAIVRMLDGRILLLCKGADSIIYSRLKKGEQKEMRRQTAEHLEMFAREGLRTLCIAYRELSEEVYGAWKKQHDVAARAIDDREEKLEAVADLIEQELTLIGGTAIEDRLQDGVPDTIELLGDAGIKLWVLTGDKVETAINIGFSCNLLNNDMELIHIRTEELETETTSQEERCLGEVERMLDHHLQAFGLEGNDEDLAAARKDHVPPAPTHALVIDGFSLRWALHDSLQQKFLLLCKQCKSVLCCRVSPAQKASVVAMVKNGLDVMTLSIGDGANDVAMIQEADVGVGIAGLEGRQAAMSSDYAIAQFRFLQRLVLVHGRWSYRRLSETICNFFYKNMVWTFPLFWYQIYCDYDITAIFDYSYIIMFNLFFTSVPVGVMGVLDQDVSDKVSLAVPQLYRRGIERLEWTRTKFWLYMIDGIYQSVMAFFIPFLVVNATSTVSGSGLNVDDLTRFGAYVAHPAVVTINMYILINTYRWDWLMVVIVIISDLFIFFWTGVYSAFESSDRFYEAAPQVYANASFWAVFIITPIICLFPRFAIKALQKVYFPYDVDIIREQEKLGKFAHLSSKPTLGAAAIVAGASSSAATQGGRGRHSTDNGIGYGEEDEDEDDVRRRKGKLAEDASTLDEEHKPIYPPSVGGRATASHNPRSQNGSDSTTFTTGPRNDSLDMTYQNLQSLQPIESRHSMSGRPSVDRARPSFDRMRASMPPVRQSFEASSDFTSAARLSQIESSQTSQMTNAMPGTLRFRSPSLSNDQADD